MFNLFKRKNSLSIVVKHERVPVPLPPAAATHINGFFSILFTFHG